MFRGSWFRLPIWWMHDIGQVPARVPDLRNPGLKLFGHRDIGASIGALKLYIALLSKTDNNSNSDTFCHTALSMSALEELSGMSRPIVARSARYLIDLGLVRVAVVRGKTNVYEIIGYGTNPWGKLPKSRFYGNPPNGATLRQMGMRGRATLNALKLYLYLAGSVDRATGRAKRTYDTIERDTGIRKSEIRRGISILINHQLIVVSHLKREDDRNPYNSPNEYEICG